MGSRRILQTTSQVSYLIRFVFTGALLLSGFYLYYGNGVEETSHGVKAAVFAMSAAGMLFVGLIPVDRSFNGRLARFFTNGGAAILTAFGGWHWIQSETNGDWFPLLAVPVIILGITSIALLMGFIGALVVAFDRRNERPSIEAELLQLTTGELDRFHQAMTNSDTRTAETFGHAVATEVLAAHILLLLMDNEERPLTYAQLHNTLSQYRFTDAQTGRILTAFASTFSRIDLMVRSGLEESKP